MKQTVLYWQHVIKTLFIPALFCITVVNTTYAQDTARAQTEDTTIQAEKPTAYPDSITNFKQFDLPPEMINEFLHMDPKTAPFYHNEFQMLHNGFYGQAQVIIKVWYIDDHIIGYLIETPFDNAGGHTIKRRINIPVKWACIPTVEGHEEHTATNLAQVNNITIESKCVGWHIQLPEEYEPGPQIKYQKRKPAKPKVGDFGKAQVTDHKEDRKKARKNAFKEQDAAPAATDSTGAAKPVKDSLP